MPLESALCHTKILKKEDPFRRNIKPSIILKILNFGGKDFACAECVTDYW